MSKGFSLIELLMTIIVLSILSAFTFSVIWQYSDLYADTKKGYVYGEAAAVLERMTRELRDAGAVDTLGTNPATYVNFSLTHGTPANGNTLTWVQYCTCSSGGKTYLYRVQTSQSAADQCHSCGACPSVANTSLMSGNIIGCGSSSGFQVAYFQGNPSPAGDSYGITLKLAGDGSASNPSITLVTRVSPRNLSGSSTGRSFNGAYYDEIN